MENRRFDQSITFCIIILNLDQWIRCYVMSSILALVAVYSAGQNRLGNFVRGPYKKQLCEIILTLEQWFKRRCRLRIFLIYSFGELSCLAEQNH